MIIYTAATPHHAFPLGSSPFSSWWPPAATVQIWSTHYPPCTVTHIWVLLSGSLQTGLRPGCRNPWGRENHLIFVFLWSVAMTPPSLLVPYLMACLPSLKVWCPGAPSCPHQKWDFPLGGKKVKRRQTQAKHETVHSHSLGTRWLFSLKGFLRSSPPCPFPLPTDPLQDSH